ncbi:hypothetical protein J5N97_019709 [Dioscorea zingiberensis]|uniref:AB hydrolase-1 domain-containing protein n=1 Tax=Dioscorea zingiberensis TaxID=325984 RepID=A0A9D5CF59_9LILI|nr:hypothetical protein J5N97_019709 [Dioscorea zingiberensis]
MPYCDSSKYHSNGATIFYRRYGHGPVKVLLIIGLAGTHDSWGPQVKGLTGTCEPNEEEAAPSGVDGGLGCEDEEGQAAGGIEVCCFDNRGMGCSSIPNKKSEYSTTIMAKDALALLNHLGWKKAHVFGHSMGGMIACKLAAIAPERLSSLALLNVTGGGFECFPKIDRQMMSLAFRFLKAKTPEQRAAVDLETHYTKEYLDEYVGSNTRRKILYQDYVKAISSNGMQSNCGFEGQINACWTHKLTSKELETIRTSGFLISVIHGRDDIIAQLDHARKLAEKLYPAARMVELHGAHLVSHERPDEVNQSLMELIKASKSKVNPLDWSNLPENRSGWLDFVRSFSLLKQNSDRTSYLVTAYNLVGKLQLSLLYFFGVFVMGFEHAKNIVIAMKPVRVAASS